MSQELDPDFGTNSSVEMFFTSNLRVGRSGIPVAPFLSQKRTPVNWQKGGTSDAELVIDFFSSRANRCTS